MALAIQGLSRRLRSWDASDVTGLLCCLALSSSRQCVSTKTMGVSAHGPTVPHMGQHFARECWADSLWGCSGQTSRGARGRVMEEGQLMLTICLEVLLARAGHWCAVCVLRPHVQWPFCSPLGCITQTCVLTAERLVWGHIQWVASRKRWCGGHVAVDCGVARRDTGVPGVLPCAQHTQRGQRER